MKKQFLILPLLILIFITGCGVPKTELDKFKQHIKKENDFKCLNNICTNEKVVGQLMKFTYKFNFDLNTFTRESEGQQAIKTSSKTVYNWSNNSATYNSITMGVVINATYNYATDEFNCNSDYEDKEYVDAECKMAKLTIKELKTVFEEIITNSGTTYFNN